MTTHLHRDEWNRKHCLDKWGVVAQINHTLHRLNSHGWLGHLHLMNIAISCLSPSTDIPICIPKIGLNGGARYTLPIPRQYKGGLYHSRRINKICHLKYIWLTTLGTPNMHMLGYNYDSTGKTVFRISHWHNNAFIIIIYYNYIKQYQIHSLNGDDPFLNQIT